MAHIIVTEQTQKQPRGKVRDLLMKHHAGETDEVNEKRDRFLIRLKNQFGYANEEAVDELERLLRQFYRINQSFNTNRTRLRIRHSPRE
ncbi:MAG TPA: hypothetical protein VN452_05740 [Longilinea sp.]|nr:hypothetical protein [Longilinea sp.]